MPRPQLTLAAVGKASLARLGPEPEERERPEPEESERDAWEPLGSEPADYARALGAAELIGGLWTPYPYLLTISAAVKAAVDGTGPPNVLVEGPPRCGKSGIVSQAAPLWFLDRKPTGKVILAGYGDDLPRESSRSIRGRVEMNPDLLRIRVDRRSSAADRWHTSAGGGVKTVGVGGAITGFGGDLIAIDDPHKNREEAESQLARERTWDWFQSTLWTRREPGAAVVVSMQRWHPDDLAGRIRAEMVHRDPSSWRVLSFPALAAEDEDWGTWTRRQGEALCPDRFPVAALESIKLSMGEYAFAGQYLQVPPPLRDRPGALWTSAQLREVRRRAPRLPDGRFDMAVVVIGVDPAKSSAPGSDETGLIAVGLDRKGNGWVLGDFSGPYGALKWPSHMEMAYDQAEADWCAVEAFAYEETEAILRAAEVTVPVRKVQARVGKRLRAMPLAELYPKQNADGTWTTSRVFHDEDAALATLEGQMVGWRPEDPDSPDRLDAYAHALTALPGLIRHRPATLHTRQIAAARI